MGDRSRVPLEEVSNLPRARTFTGGAGTKRPITPSDGGSQPKRMSAFSNRNSSTRRGTFSSIPAPPLSSASIAASRRQSEYNRNADTSSATSAMSGRARPTLSFSQAHTTSRPRLLPSSNSIRSSKSSIADEENRRVPQLEAAQKEMKLQLENLTKFLSAGNNDAPEIEHERQLFRVKLDIAEQQLAEAKKEAAGKSNQLEEAKLHVKKLWMEINQHSTNAEKEILDWRRRAINAEDDLHRFQNKYEDIKETHKDLEKRQALERIQLQAKLADVKRLENDVVALRRKQKVFEAERDRYENEIRRLEVMAVKLETAHDQANLEVEECHATIARFESEISDEKLKVKTLRNELAALRAQYDETIVQCEERNAELEKLHSEGNMSKTHFEKQLRDAEEKNAKLQENYSARVSELETSLTKAEKSLAEAEQQVEAHQKTLSGHAIEVARLNNENSLLGLKVESKSRELSEKDATLEECSEEIGRLESLAMENEKVRRKLHNEVMELKGNIRVFCRMRPFLGDEENVESNFSFQKRDKITAIPPAGYQSKEQMEFKFDYVFGPKAAQSDVFVEISQLVQSALDGYRVCIFAYGQTGSGKTHTMIGDESDENMGMIPRSVQQIFESSSSLEKDGWKFEFGASFIEIYNEKCHDLLSQDDAEKELQVKPDPKSDKVGVVGLTIEEVTATEKVRELVDRANRKRATAATTANAQSSRSHSIFQMHIKGTHMETGETLQGALNLVDLAGSERLVPSRAEEARLKETQAINKSLSALSDVIVKLGDTKSKHIPFRNSKLTTLLRESLSGRSKVLMFVNLSPEAASFQETVCSLRFARTVNACHVGTTTKKKANNKK